MKDDHDLMLKEITDEILLADISGGDSGSDAVQAGWGSIVSGVAGAAGYSCSLNGNFYSNPISGGFTCVGGASGGGSSGF